ncbi:MAG TPA: hypothetical protein VFD92_26905 [Candidatus Binatia bacterium]|nr:hypothetical protein [Candidatus Binatia bacterium]
MRLRHKRTREIEDAHIEVHYIVNVGDDVYEIADLAERFELVSATPADLTAWARARRWFNRTHDEIAPELEPVKLQVLQFRTGRAA